MSENKLLVLVLLYIVGGLVCIVAFRKVEFDAPYYHLAFKYFSMPACALGVAMFFRIYRTSWRKSLRMVLSAIVLSTFMVFMTIFLTAPYLLAINNMVGTQTPVTVSGKVTGKFLAGSKATAYVLTVRDDTLGRAFEIKVSKAKYCTVKISDPIFFRMKKGSLGIYYLLDQPR